MRACVASLDARHLFFPLFSSFFLFFPLFPSFFLSFPLLSFLFLVLILLPTSLTKLLDTPHAKSQSTPRHALHRTPHSPIRLPFGPSLPRSPSYCPPNFEGPAGAWCWIVRSKDHWRYIQFYFPLWIIFAFNITLYTRLVIRLRSVFGSQGGEGGNGDMMVFWRLGMYPVILVLCWSAATFNRLYNTANPDNPLFWLTCIQVLRPNQTSGRAANAHL